MERNEPANGGFRILRMGRGTGKSAARMKIARNIALLLLRGYKLVISPWLPASCRYVPTCSEYAMEAIDRFGVLRGSAMAMQRILRCHPFAKAGYDPVVPARVSERAQNRDRWLHKMNDHRCGAS